MSLHLYLNSEINFTYLQQSHRYILTSRHLIHNDSDFKIFNISYTCEEVTMPEVDND